MWNDRYSEPGFAYGTEPNDFLRDEYQRIPEGGRVLCLAEGEGRNAVFLAEKGFDVTAIDLSDVGLDKANKLADERGVQITTQVADVTTFDFGHEQWDGIVSIWAHLPHQAQADMHAKIAPALKPGGVFILEAYTPQHLDMGAIGGPPASQKDRFVRLSDLQQELGDLNEIIATETNREISEGSCHQGLSAVVQFIAKKA